MSARLPLLPCTVPDCGSGCDQALVLPPGPTLGSELVAAPYRWDQRMFAALLRMLALDAAGAPAYSSGACGAAAAAEVPGAESSIAALCEVRRAG